MNENDFRKSFSLYWPEHIQEMKEFKQISKAADIEVKRIWEALMSVLNNRYLTSMNEAECTELEIMLGIIPMPEEQLEDRVRRIKGYFVSNRPYTQNKLIEVLNVLCGGPEKYILLVEPDKYTVHVGVKLSSMRLTDNVRELVNNMVPANMIRDVYVVFNRWSSFKKVTWGSVKAETWDGLRNDPKWQEGVRR